MRYLSKHGGKTQIEFLKMKIAMYETQKYTKYDHDRLETTGGKKRWINLKTKQ